MTLKFSILIPAYNEEKNISSLLDILTKEKIYPPFQLENIIVIASGCTDSTEAIVKRFRRRDKRIKLISMQKRLGKAEAINIFLKEYRGDIVVMISADVLPAHPDTLNTLLQPLLREEVGFVGCRPIPLNPLSTLSDRISSLIWHIHHKISLSYPPKVGELIAFRNVIRKIPSDTLADEERISAVIQKKGYRVVYAKDAVVYNMAPRKVSELIEQRKRIFIGHLLIKKELGYTVPTLSLKRLSKVVIGEIFSNPLKILTIIPLTLLEMFSRFLGYISYFTGSYKAAWKVCKSTKRLPDINSIL